VRTFATIAALSFALAGCEPSLSVLMAPMEPTQASIAAHRRALTETEKDLISAAVMGKLVDKRHKDFRWPALVVRSQNGATDYCGEVSGDDVVGEYDITNANANFRDYYARLFFDRRGALTKVNIEGVGRIRNDNLPTAIDSICIQDGYVVR
jgi:hypothetical protein